MDMTDLIRRVRIGRPTAVTTRSDLVFPIAVPTIGILVGEGLLYLGNVRLALSIHLLLFAGCLLAPVVAHHETSMYHVFLLVPLFRILNFGLPVLFENTLSWLSLVYGGILFATYDVARVRKEVELPDWGDVHGLVTNIPLAAIVAGVFVTIEYPILEPNVLVETWTSLDFVFFVIVMLGFVAFGEELLFRGLLQGSLTERVGAIPAIGISAIVFGMMHSTQGVLAVVGFGVASGLVLGYIYYRTENLLLVTLIHGGANVILYGPFIS